MAGKITVGGLIIHRSINTTSMDTNEAPKHLGVLYLFSVALLSVFSYPMMEEALYLLSVVMCADSGGVENEKEDHIPIY